MRVNILCVHAKIYIGEISPAVPCYKIVPSKAEHFIFLLLSLQVWKKKMLYEMLYLVIKDSV